jgi:hypothetical protein
MIQAACETTIDPGSVRSLVYGATGLWRRNGSMRI